MRRTATLALLGVVLLGGCAVAPPLSEVDIRAHRAMSREFLDRVHARDWQGLSEMYAEDAVVMQPNTEALVGRRAIRDYWASMPPIKELSFHDDGIVGEGDLAYVYGRYWLTFDLPGAPSDHGKYLDVRRRRADGTWEYVAEMANSSRPPEGGGGRHERVPATAEHPD